MENYNIDTYNTLVALAHALQSEANTERSPFMVVAVPKDDSETAVAVSGDVGHVVAMYAALTESFVDSLKKRLSRMKVLELLTTITSVAVAKNFPSIDMPGVSVDDDSSSVKDDTDVETVSIREKTKIICEDDIDPLGEDFLTFENGEEYEILLAFENRATGVNFVVFSNNEPDDNGKVKSYVAKTYPKRSDVLLPVSEREKRMVMLQRRKWLNEENES